MNEPHPNHSIEITLFTLGDSRDVNTWSNLPYFFSKALVSVGVKLNRVDIRPNKCLAVIYTLLFGIWARLFCRLLGRNVYFNFFRSRINAVLISHKIRTACRQFPQADFNVFLTFTFSSYTFSGTPVVHYCDQMLEELIEGQGRSALSFTEKISARQERQNLRHAAYIFATNQHCVDFIREHYGLVETTRCLRTGLNLEIDALDIEELLQKKRSSFDLLFIGRGVKWRGVDILVEAFERFNTRNSSRFQLQLVGITPQQLNCSSENVHFYGWLRKDNPQEYQTYINLLRNARLFIFPARTGPVPCAMKEALFMCTPVITSNFWDVDHVIQDGFNGVIIDSLAADAFAQSIEGLVTNEQRWEEYARNAHASVMGYSWNDTVEQFLAELVHISWTYH